MNNDTEKTKLNFKEGTLSKIIYLLTKFTVNGK